jgi:predicted chitinase
MSISSALKSTVSALTGFAGNTTRAILGLSTVPAGKSPKNLDELNQAYSQSLSSSTKILGAIFSQMQKARAEELSNRMEQENQTNNKKQQDDKFNEELIKALSIRRKLRKPKKEPTKKEEPKPTEKKKEEPKKEEKKVEPKPTEKKVEEKKVEPKPQEKKVEKKEEVKPPPEKVPVKEVPKEAVKPPPKEVPKEVPKPTAEKVAPTPPKAPVKAGKGIAGVVSAGAGTIATITAALVASGITNAYAQKAILANVGKESGFKPRDENLAAYANTSNDRIKEVFTKRASKYTDEELNQIKKDPYKFGEMVYGKDTAMGKSMGNTQEGDGFKYRGRGSIQLTGKNNYSAYSKAAGVDLIANPELANQPDIDAKIVASFVKKGVGSKLNDFTDQQTANRAVTQAIGGSKLNLDVGVGAKILSKVEEFSVVLNEDTSTGTKIDQSSKENKDLKAPTTNKSQTIVNNTITPSSEPEADIIVRGNKKDDRSALQRKTQ